MKRWDIYLANVRFEDAPNQSKIRPVIVIDNNTVVSVTINCIKMTSQPPRNGEYVLKDWSAAGLKKQTTVRISKVLKLNKADFIKQIGVVQPIDIVEIQKLLTLE